ncbi:hypothetical protein FUAX_51090 (plasmid) [Fulvitalea axinellae]|uniref:Protein-PII uridylyltransferase N-terminal domain-containing protein n=1 Tax=Fulvitalea axinellae TaxID=1182444 RepID=A0AAU9D0J5_9BACT|nr:hypothetical protein FUAX_51090 [Fulvitalea axinellae]
MRITKRRSKPGGSANTGNGSAKYPVQCFLITPPKESPTPNPSDFFPDDGVEDVDGQLFDSLQVSDIHGFLSKMESLASWSPVNMQLSTLKSLEQAGLEDDDAGIKQALEVLREKQLAIIQASLGAEEGSRLFETFREKDFTEMFKLLGTLDNDALMKLAKDAAITAEQMKAAFSTACHSQLTPFEKMKFSTHSADYLLERATEESLEMTGPGKHPFSIMATGGFGRKEMQPASDIDFGVIGHDDDMELIRLITDLIFFKLNLARTLFRKLQPPKSGANVGFESDPLWMQSTYSVGPAKVMENSALKGTSEDARIVRSFAGSEHSDPSTLEEQILEARDSSRELVPHWAELKDTLSTYRPVLPEAPCKFNLKTPLLRFLTMSLQKLSLIYSLPPMGSRERVEWLKENRKITPRMAEKLVFSLEVLAGLRQKCHAFYQGEKDDVFLMENSESDNPEGLCPIQGNEFIQLTTATHFLGEFYHELLGFAQRKNPAVLMEMPRIKRGFFRGFLGK